MKYKTIQRINPLDRTKSKCYASPMNKGKIVNLGELGTLHVPFSSKGVDMVAEVNAGKISGVKIVFTSGVELKKHLSDIRFEKGDSAPIDEQPNEV